MVRAELAEISETLAEILDLLRSLGQDLPKYHASTYQAIESLFAIHREIDSLRTLPQMATPYGGFAISPDLARLIVEQVLLNKPVMIVELGSGASTILLGHVAETLPGTRVVSLEHDPLWYANTLIDLETHRVHNVDLRYAPLTPIEIDSREYLWYSIEALKDLRDIDLVLVDGPPGDVGPKARFPAGPVLHPKCRDGCLWIVDDTVREDEQEVVRHWMDTMKLDLLFERVWRKKGATVLRAPTT